MEKSTYKDTNIRIIELLKEYGFKKDRTFFLKVINDCIINIKPRKFSFSERFFVDVHLYYKLIEQPVKVEYFHLYTEMSLFFHGYDMFDLENFDFNKFKTDFDLFYCGHLQTVSTLSFLKEFFPERIAEFKLSFAANPNRSEYEDLVNYSKMK
jgi:hypothetical protein